MVEKQRKKEKIQISNNKIMRTLVKYNKHQNLNNYNKILSTIVLMPQQAKIT
jgi:hypothetical protein